MNVDVSGVNTFSNFFVPSLRLTSPRVECGSGPISCSCSCGRAREGTGSPRTYCQVLRTVAMAFRICAAPTHGLLSARWARQSTIVFDLLATRPCLPMVVWRKRSPWHSKAKSMVYIFCNSPVLASHLPPPLLSSSIASAIMSSTEQPPKEYLYWVVSHPFIPSTRVHLDLMVSPRNFFARS